MNRILFIIAAAVIIGIAVAQGQGGMMMRSLERSIAWSLGREVVHGVFHGVGYR